MFRPEIFKKVIVGLVGLALLGMAGTAHAVLLSGVVDPSTDAALAGGTVVDFDTGPGGTFSAPVVTGPLTISGSGAGGFFFIDSDFVGNFNTRGTRSLHNNSSGAQIFDFEFSSLVDAFGFLWGAVDNFWLLEALSTGGSVIESHQLGTTGSSNNGDYFGIAAPDIAGFRLSNTSSREFVFIDNVTFVSAVPEPASLTLLGLGLAAVAFLAWRRNRRHP